MLCLTHVRCSRRRPSGRSHSFASGGGRLCAGSSGDKVKYDKRIRLASSSLPSVFYYTYSPFPASSSSVLVSLQPICPHHSVHPAKMPPMVRFLLDDASVRDTLDQIQQMRYSTIPTSTLPPRSRSNLKPGPSSLPLPLTPLTLPPLPNIRQTSLLPLQAYGIPNADFSVDLSSRIHQRPARPGHERTVSYSGSRNSSLDADPGLGGGYRHPLLAGRKSTSSNSSSSLGLPGFSNDPLHTFDVPLSSPLSLEEDYAYSSEPTYLEMAPRSSRRRRTPLARPSSMQFSSSSMLPMAPIVSPTSSASDESPYMTTAPLLSNTALPPFPTNSNSNTSSSKRTTTTIICNLHNCNEPKLVWSNFCYQHQCRAFQCHNHTYKSNTAFCEKHYMNSGVQSIYGYAYPGPAIRRE